MYLHHTHTFIFVNFWIRASGNRQGGSSWCTIVLLEASKLTNTGSMSTKRPKPHLQRKLSSWLKGAGNPAIFCILPLSLEENAERSAENVDLPMKPT
jgi:hypothetical protein